MLSSTSSDPKPIYAGKCLPSLNFKEVRKKILLSLSFSRTLSSFTFTQSHNLDCHASVFVTNIVDSIVLIIVVTCLLTSLYIANYTVINYPSLVSLSYIPSVFASILLSCAAYIYLSENTFI